MEQPVRLRDLGLSIGQLPTGEHNAITDVDGVLVGHAQVIRDEPDVVRSGVTVVVPEQGRVWERNLFAGSHVLNGNGEMTGLAYLNEFGLMHGPIAITGTHSIGAVHEGLVAHELEQDTGFEFRLPLVAETYDGWLSDAAAMAVRPKHVRDALANAKGGAVPEGNMGGGTGMITHEFKGGIGTSSRRAGVAGENWTVGVLVQSNYGRRSRLRLGEHPVGQMIPDTEVPTPWPESRDDGSIIVVIATDAPLLPHQCKRLAQRAGLGVGRVGGMGEPGSGDIFVAFSTGNHHRRPTRRRFTQRSSCPIWRLPRVRSGHRGDRGEYLERPVRGADDGRSARARGSRLTARTAEGSLWTLNERLECSFARPGLQTPIQCTRCS